MDLSALLFIIALVLAIIAAFDGRAPWLVIAVILVCIGLLVGDVDLDSHH